MAGRTATLMITLIFLLSAARGQGDVPVIESVELNVDSLSDGGEITFTLTALSNAPVDWFSSSFDGPTANIYGGGRGVRFTEISPGRWLYSRTETLSAFSPSGIYTFSGISVRNEGELESETWPPVTFTVNNSQVAQIPVIESVELSADSLNDGGEITFTLTALSNAPVDWLSSSFDGPTASIYGGGRGVRFTEISPGRWVYSRTETLSAFSPSGIYTFSGISVRNEGELESETWQPVTFTVDNSQVAQIPVIESVELSADSLRDGGDITFTLTALSQRSRGLVQQQF